MAHTAGLLLLTLVLRIAVIVADGDRLQSDPDAYVRLATMLADGHGYAAADGATPTAYRPVLYPLLLAGPLALGISTALTVVFWNLLAGLLFVVASIQLAREVGLNRTGILTTGFMAAGDPLLIRYTTEPMTENVCAAIFTMSLVYLLRFVRSVWRPGGPANFGVAATAGLLLGLCALCRPVVLISCVFLTLTITVLQLKLAHKQQGLFIRQVAWMWVPAIVAALTIAPWVIRNAVQFGAFIPATTHGGYTLLLGNNSEFYERVVSGKQAAWDGDSLDHWQRRLHQQLDESGLKHSDERTVDQWMYQQAKTEMKNQPKMAVRAIVLRWHRFWALTPTTSGSSLPRFVFYTVAAWYGLLGVGLVTSLLRLCRNRDIFLLWMGVASFLVVHSFFWTNTRMRAPLTGLLVVLAVAGWTYLRSRMWRPETDSGTGQFGKQKRTH